jgi:membrane fusion protein, multidrug efflux system
MNEPQSSAGSPVGLETAPATRHETKLLPPPPPEAPPRRRSRLWIWILVLALAAAAGYYYWTQKKSAPAASDGSTGRKGGGRGAAAGAIQVVAVKAQKGNIAVYFNGLGAVTPLATVTIKSRVDGQLMSLHYKEGDIVHQGDLLAEIDPRPYQATLTQNEGQLVRDQALLANAKVDQTRYELLLKQNAIPEQQLATQKALVDQDEGIVKTDEGLIDAAKVNLIYTKITAPITGRVGLRLVDSGNIVHASDSNGLVVITEVEPISVIFTIAEDQLPQVLQKWQAGQRLVVDAFDRDMKTKLSTGTLDTIDNQIDQTTGTLKLRAIFNNSRNELFPNQFVNARMLVQEKTGVILLPAAAVQRNSNSTYVYLVQPTSKVTVRNITIGTTEGDQSEVVSGLQEGDTVVMTGIDKLQEGSQVVVHFPGEKPAPGQSGQAQGKNAAGQQQSGKPASQHGKGKKTD